jgi:hypothetical protein
MGKNRNFACQISAFSLQHSAFDCAFAVLAFSLQPLAFASTLRNAVNQLQSLLYIA